MADYPNPNAPGGRPLGTPAPRKSSDILTDRLLQMRQRAELAEHQRDEALAQNRQLREQLNALADSVAEGATADGSADQGRVAALQRELEEVRQQLAASAQEEAATPNPEIEAELQAVRQEAALLRQTVKEKDKVLEELASQCRSLEDSLEDRDQEMDRLHQDLEHSRSDSLFSEDSSGANVLGIGSVGGDSDTLYAFQERDSSEILDGANLIGSSSSSGSRRTLLLAAAGGLLIGVLGVGAVTLLSVDKEASSDAQAIVPQQSPAAQPLPVKGKTPAVEVAEGERTASPAQSVAEESKPVLAQDPLSGGADGPLLTGVPGGSFIMGNKRGLLNQEEKPAHQVEVGPFLIGKYEVTFAQYDLFAKATGRPLPDDSGWGRDERPVIGVSWDDALAYTRWLSQQTAKSYRLPTEAEWEYAARAGTTDRYWWGISAGSGQAVCFDCGSKWDGRSTAPVGSLAANPFGLHDTAGNVMEWVADCYNSNYKGAPENGGAWLSGDCGQRMVRGGAFNKPSSSLRSSARYHLPQDARFNMLGFRVVRE